MQEVGGYVDFVVCWQENAGFVEEWVVGCASCGEKEGVRRRGSSEVGEGSVILE